MNENEAVIISAEVWENGTLYDQNAFEHQKEVLIGVTRLRKGPS